MHCDYKDKGCSWGGKFRERDDHLKECEYNSTQCELCGQTIAASTAEDHKLRLCKNAVIDFPYQIFGCSNENQLPKSDMEMHLHEHAKHVVKSVYKIENEAKETRQKVNELAFQVDMLASQNQPEDLETDLHMDEVEHANHASESDANSKQYGNRDCAGSLVPFSQCYQPHDDGNMPTFVPTPQVYYRESRNIDATWMEPHLDGLKEEIADLNTNSHRKDVEIAALKEKILQLEKIVRAKTADDEQTYFRLSLIENSVYKPNMVWKIPQFSQRKADAESGKYTSIFSLPFYTGRYGYKMCLRLYILGDGIGKNTHMSLFFVVMRGEFDNILQWPFTHKVTFKLINQKGACDVVDTFQPDEMSNSFRKPKSDMNIASGCPRFVSHQELQNGGFIEDDTIFIALFVK